MATFTFNKKTEEYDVIGTPDEVEAGAFCEVTKKSGEKTTVTIDKVSKPFTAKFGPLAGKTAVIGTVKKEAKSSTRYGGAAPGGRRCPECGSRDCAKAWDRNDLCDED